MQDSACRNEDNSHIVHKESLAKRRIWTGDFVLFVYDADDRSFDHVAS
jgi:hypothetical protein